MTNLDEKGLEAAFFAWIENPVGNASVKELIASAIAAYLASPGGNEPVAWRWRYKADDNSLTDWHVSADRLSSNDERQEWRLLEVQPLYAHSTEDYRRGIEDAAKAAEATQLTGGVPDEWSPRETLLVVKAFLATRDSVADAILSLLESA